jgi:hypothetical protein
MKGSFMQNDNELEQLLRKAPSPAAPFGLEQRLIQQASRPKEIKQTNSWTWFSILQGRSWAPALALFAVLAGLLTAVAFQQSTLNDLKREELAAQSPPADGQSQNQGQSSAAWELEQLQKQSVELQALRNEMAEIEGLLAEQSAIAQENAALRAELSNLTPNNPELSPEFQAAMAAARKKAERIKCVNNLKNVGLAARIWATDNGDKSQLPRDFLTMTNELGTPKILVCPSDPSRTQPVENWQQFGAVGSSYEILSPGISEQIPTAVYARCPVHNNVCRADGSVIQLRADQQLIQRDGHWEIGE